MLAWFYQHFCKRYFAVLRKYRQLSGRWAWRETDVKGTDLETLTADVLEGQYGNPVRIIGLEGSEAVAHELRQHCEDQMRELPDFLQDLVAALPPDERRDRAKVNEAVPDGLKLGLLRPAGSQDVYGVPKVTE
jgi:hypothetical protein